MGSRFKILGKGMKQVVDIDACTQKNSCTQKGVLGDISNFISGISKKTVKCEGRGVGGKEKGVPVSKKVEYYLKKKVIQPVNVEEDMKDVRVLQQLHQDVLKFKGNLDPKR
ncbi:hypothetical protein ACOSQ3_016674 [Xanthoceras sorbifolium]